MHRGIRQNQKRKKEKILSESSFEKFDRIKAKEAFALWQADENGEIDDYILRKRKDELNRLVRKVIKNELCERDRLLISLHWYQGKTKDEIAEIIGVDRSTVFRRFEKINSIIYEKLKYALEYRYGDEFSTKAILLIKKDVSAKPGNSALESIGERVERLRREQYLSRNEVSSLTGISTERLSAIEKSGKELTMIELKKLAAFFRVTSDYIVFGKERILRDRVTGKPTLVAI